MTNRRRKQPEPSPAEWFERAVRGLPQTEPDSEPTVNKAESDRQARAAFDAALLRALRGSTD